MPHVLRSTDLYRLPWSLSDNAINWLEPTSACNLVCDGCYRKNVPNAHKPLETVREELDTFKRLRRADGVSIAGGDPLTHPDIERIVAMVADDGMKPILNTNGELLTPEKLRALKKAGVFGFTFHIDSGQKRPHMRGKTEIELNELRLRYARMLADAGDLSCAFNATVYGETLSQVPDVVAWGQEHIDVVHILVFIAYRAAPVHAGYDYLVRGRKVDMTPIAYAIQSEREISILSTDIVDTIRTRWPDFAPSAYLNGTEKPEHFKWLLTMRIGSPDRIYGYVGPRFMEISQSLHHLLHGTYLAYTRPKTLRRMRSMFLLSPLDRGLARAASAYLHDVVRRPAGLFRSLRMQAVTIIQPADFMPNGALSMCDGCPDITVHEGKLVWSCRMEELHAFGDWIHAVPTDGTTRRPEPAEFDR